MNNVEHTLLTGEVKLDSDKDGNVVMIQNKQEIKLTPSQVLEVKSYFDCVIDAVSLVNKKDKS